MLMFALFACVPLESGDAGPRGNDAVDAVVIGDRAVDLPLTGADGRDFYLADDRGKVIFLDMSGFH
jgi:hypothetical protein